jgi:tripartite-type tricarboxylate transporter receptor subunit TctC
VGTLTTNLRRVLERPDTRKTLSDFGLEVVPSDGPLLSAYIASQTVFWHRLISERGIKVE